MKNLNSCAGKVDERKKIALIKIMAKVFPQMSVGEFARLYNNGKKNGFVMYT